jgi:hypothetical protein
VDAARRARFVAVDVEEGDAAGEFHVEGVAREQRAAGGIRFGDHVHGMLRAQVAEHPLDVAGERNAPRAPGQVAHAQHGELHRGVERHVHPQLAEMPSSLCS